MTVFDRTLVTATRRPAIAGMEALVPPLVAWLTIAAIAELLILRTFTRVAIHIPAIDAMAGPYTALAEAGRFAYYTAAVLAIASLAAMGFAAWRSGTVLGQLAAVARVEARERHREVVAQAQVGELRRVVGGRSDGVGVEAALEHVVGELLVVAADAGVEAGVLLHDGGLDLVEAVHPVAVADDGEHALAAGLVGGEEVAHAARRVHGCHGSIFPGRSGGPR